VYNRFKSCKGVGIVSKVTSIANASVLIGFEIAVTISNSEHSKINNSLGLGVAYGYSFSRLYGSFPLRDGYVFSYGRRYAIVVPLEC